MDMMEIYDRWSAIMILVYMVHKYQQQKMGSSYDFVVFQKKLWFCIYTHFCPVHNHKNHDWVKMIYIVFARHGRTYDSINDIKKQRE